MNRTSITRGLALAGLFALASFAASAQTPAPARGASTPHINARQAKQEQRIQQGTASGSLNAKETQRLNAQEQHVDNLQSKAAADGQVTAQERTRIRAAERRTSRHIGVQKHDAQTAAPQ